MSVWSQRRRAGPRARDGEEYTSVPTPHLEVIHAPRCVRRSVHRLMAHAAGAPRARRGSRVAVQAEAQPERLDVGDERAQVAVGKLRAVGDDTALPREVGRTGAVSPRT